MGWSVVAVGLECGAVFVAWGADGAEVGGVVLEVGAVEHGHDVVDLVGSRGAVLGVAELAEEAVAGEDECADALPGASASAFAVRHLHFPFT